MREYSHSKEERERQKILLEIVGRVSVEEGFGQEKLEGPYVKYYIDADPKAGETCVDGRGVLEKVEK